MLFNYHSEIPVDVWRWGNFSPDEPNLVCPCCGEFYLDPIAIDRLQAALDLLGRSVRINSGHRCAIHNARVGGVPLSQHKLVAFDVSLAGQDRGDVLEALKLAGFSSFGLYQTFIHTDTRPGRLWFGKGARHIWNGLI
jgi:zinc D-Ala-D-Ala carboxypeptidase